MSPDKQHVHVSKQMTFKKFQAPKNIIIVQGHVADVNSVHFPNFAASIFHRTCAAECSAQDEETASTVAPCTGDTK